MAIAVECPVCEFQGKVADDQQGQETVCKGCGHKFTVSSASSGSAAEGSAGAATATAAATVVVQCPSCKVGGKVPASARGKKIKCPKCSNAFVVPGGPASTPAPGGPAARLSDTDLPAPVQETAKTPAATASTTTTPAPKPRAQPKPPPDPAPIEGAEVIADDADQPIEVVDDAAIVIDAICPKCKHNGTVPEKFAGKKVKCPRCSTLFFVGNPQKSSPAIGKKSADKPAAAESTAAPPAPAAEEANPFAFDDAPPVPPAKPKTEAVKPKPAPVPTPAKVEAAADDDEEEESPRKLKKKESDEDGTDRTVRWIGGGLLGVAVIVVVAFAGIMLALNRTKEPENADAKPADAKAAKTIADVSFSYTQGKTPEQVIGGMKGKIIVDPPPAEKGKAGNESPSDPKDKGPEAVIKPAPDPMPEKKPGPVQREGDIVWVNADKGSAQIENIRVRVTSASIDFIKGPKGNSLKKYLLVQIQIENQDAAKQIGYRGWGVTDVMLGKSAPAQLTDNTGKNYRMPTKLELVAKPPGQVTQDILKPGQTVEDLLVFEPVIEKIEYLKLALPGINLNGDGTLGLIIPAQMIGGMGNVKDPVAKAPMPPPADDPQAKKAAQARIKELVGKLKTGKPPQREAALIQLGDLGHDMGMEATSIVPDLVTALRDKDESVRAAAAEALGKIGPPAANTAINALISALRDEFWRVKAAACEALSKFGPAAKEAIPLLQKLQTSKDEEVATKASLALSKIDEKGQARRPPMPKQGPKGPPPPKGLPPAPPKQAPPAANMP
jgi:hypothetical protein